MKSQWECLLENLGEWQGSFTQFSPQGELLEDTPTIVSFEGLNNNQTMRQIVRRLPPGKPVEEKVLEYSSLGRSVLFFDNGAFSQGSIQLAPFAEFGAELGLIDGDRRLRLVQLFDKTGKLDRITLIREKLVNEKGNEAGEAGKDINNSSIPNPKFQIQSGLTVDDLLGEWQGAGITLYVDGRSPDTHATKLRVEKNGDRQLTHQLTFNQGDSTRNISSTARIENTVLYFDEGPQPIQMLLLPSGASSTCPLHVKVGRSCFLEVGWLQKTDIRQRLIRRYNDKGEWVSLTLITEQRVNHAGFE